jgi:transposase
MIAAPANVQVWLAAGVTYMRKGFDGLSALVQTQLAEDTFSGQMFVFRGRRGDRIKALWWDGFGLCLFYQRLGNGRFIFAAHSISRIDELLPWNLTSSLQHSGSLAA